MLSVHLLVKGTRIEAQAIFFLLFVRFQTLHTMELTKSVDSDMEEMMFYASVLSNSTL